MNGTAETASKAFWCICAKCRHTWAAAYYPLDVATFARIGKKAICPKCGGKALVAKQDNGVLQEPAEAETL